MFGGWAGIMLEASFEPTSAVVLRFNAHSRTGRVRCYYGITPRAVDSGFPALSGWAKERRAGVGFPTIKCEVEGERPGYWNNFGWIQWVTQDFDDGRKPFRVVDRVPAFLDRDLPFATLGYAPNFFDAPAYLSLPAVDFRASLFLCTLPTMSRREAIAPLAGFTWGYRIARKGTRPIAHPLKLATKADWQRVRSELKMRHRNWKFATRYAEVAANPA